MKRILALLLSILLILGTLTFNTLSAESNFQKHYAGIGNHTVTLQVDPNTNTPPSDFGTTAANGKVWTDKSVTVSQDHFEVTLSALAQEYISESQENHTSSVAADVVMILDLSASMQKNNLTLDNTTMPRTKAMVKAVNEALEIIMQANSHNRVLIYTYQSDDSGRSPVTNEFLPLGHYTNTSWSNTDVFSDNSGKYLDYTNGSSGVISSAANLKKDGANFSKTSLSTANGTCTQHGILKGVQTLASAIAQENKSVDRKPYVLLFTDGAPGNATKTWYNSGSNSCNFSHSNSSTAEISALTVLSAAYMKDVLDTAYRTYNGKNMGIEWFNIGLGVGNSELGSLFLQPWTITTGTSNNAKNMRSNIATYTTGQYADYASYATSYTYTIDSYLVDSGDDLEAAFTELAGTIEEETKVITSPILTVENAVSALTFTDTIGAGMSVNNIYLHPDEETAIFGIANDNIYSFNGYDTTATLTIDSYNRSVLTWNVPADEVAIFAFANRANPSDGTYTAADPIRLTYDVRVANPNSYEGNTFYSNATAKAEFRLPNDNTYYYEDDGAMKSAPFTAQSKKQNITGLSNFSTSYTTEPIQKGVSVNVTLGNNGKLSPATLLKKSAEDSNVQVGTAATFTLTVINKGQTNLSDVVITDTLPEGLTYKSGSVKNATIDVENLNLTFTIPSIAVGQTITVTYDALLTANAETGETFTNTASITRINEVNVYGPIETSYTITSYRTYRVLYEWTGNIPVGQFLPSDSNCYATGAYYQVDTNYNSQTKIENKDRFGNVTERWTFSGWDDPNLGQMGEADVTVRGVWNYENFTYPAHQVIYTWSGDIPPDKTLPTDKNSYIKNQPYTVDSTYTAATVIEVKDAHGNINGRYTFSGWADPNRGIMGDTDVTIPGVWTFESVNIPAHRVIYTWSGTIPENQTLPTDPMLYVKNQVYSVDTTYTNETEFCVYDVYGNMNGRYTFSGWTDPNDKIMGETDVTIHGVWEYESLTVPTHKVIYTWSGEIPPDALLPTDSNTYVKNQTYLVDSTYTSATVIPTYDIYGNMNGRYTFSGWTDPNNGVMGDADVTLRGVWEYESLTVPAHKVIYTWSGEIPPDALLPTDSNTYVKNQPYSVDSTYTSATDIPTYDTYGNMNGRYTFSGWTDPNDKIMGETDVTIHGVWVYESVNIPAHRVIYTWSGTIPENQMLPTDPMLYVKNQVYSVDTAYTNETEFCVYDAYGNINGRYTFSGWTDPNNGVMGDADVTISGVWNFDSVDAPAHRVYYVWSGEVPPDVALPTDDNTYVKNQTYSVDTTFTSETKVPTYDNYGNINGRYTFSGWTDPNNEIMGDEDITILGVWEFESITPPSAFIPSEDAPATEPDIPKTGELIPTSWLFAIWTFYIIGIILLSILCKKKKHR